MRQSASDNKFGLDYYAVTLDLFRGVGLRGTIDVIEHQEWCNT